jgi:uncharacterized protein (TIGR00369 family)
MSAERSLSPVELELATNFINQIPFNQYVGLEIVDITKEEACFELKMREDLVGNWLQGILHGGVIATALDVAGGAVALIGAYNRLLDIPEAERPDRLAKLGTIDIRVDYLRPGKGEQFFASATILRIGNKVAVTRMSFRNEQDELLAVGTGTYLCG